MSWKPWWVPPITAARNWNIIASGIKSQPVRGKMSETALPMRTTPRFRPVPKKSIILYVNYMLVPLSLPLSARELFPPSTFCQALLHLTCNITKIWLGASLFSPSEGFFLIHNQHRIKISFFFANYWHSRKPQRAGTYHLLRFRNLNLPIKSTLVLNTKVTKMIVKS